MRSLLAATYYYGSRHLKAAFPASDEPLAFATRRLMEASVVPLPARLAARLPSHLAAPGRTLAVSVQSRVHACREGKPRWRAQAACPALHCTMPRARKPPSDRVVDAWL